MDFKGKTAVVTGASSGIGVGYANELAARGAKLVLVARRKDLLDALAAKLTKDHGVEVSVIAMDLGTLSAGQELVDALKKLNVEPEVLINNAGFGTSGRFAEEDRARVQQEIVLNVATLVDLTAVYLPQMLKRNSGAIVNIASTASYQPVPGMAVYAATKAFVRSFTSAVWGEVKGTNVRVLTVSPGATATEFFDVAKAKSMGKLAPIQDVVAATFKALNAKRSKPAIIVGRQNAVMAFASRLFSAKFIIGVAASMFLNKK